jgi:hypothetical protein
MTNQEASKILDLMINLDNNGHVPNRDLVVEAIQMAIDALGEQKWIPCEPSELPKDKKLWVTHYKSGCIYVDELFWDMTEWSDTIEDVIAYKPYIEPEPYREDGD